MKIFLPTLLFLLLLAPGHAVSGERLHFATDSFPPHYYSNEHGPTGVFHELLKLTLGKLGITFTITQVPWNRAILMAETGKSDGLPGISKTPEREQNLIFTEEPLINTEIVFFFPAHKKFEYTGIDSLTGKTIGVRRGFNYDGLFRTYQNFVKEEGESTEQNFKKLAAGRLDLVIGYKTIGLQKLQDLRLRSKIDYARTPYHTEPLYMTFSKKSGHEELAKKFSRELKKVKSSKACRDAMKSLHLPEGVTTPCY